MSIVLVSAIVSMTIGALGSCFIVMRAIIKIVRAQVRESVHTEIERAGSRLRHPAGRAGVVDGQRSPRIVLLDEKSRGNDDVPPPVAPRYRSDGYWGDM